MGMGRKPVERQADLWIATTDLPRSPGHVFYEKLNALLAEANFDRYVEGLCQDYYAGDIGRSSIPPGIYFRMLFIGYFEELGSQRGIAWRCADSFSLRAFLGVAWNERTPDHSSLSRIRQRLPLSVHEEIFAFVLQVAQQKKLLRGKTVAIDATTLEANAAMKAIVRKETGEDWKEYLQRLAVEEGIDNPTDEDLRRFDKKRTNKKVSNQEWQSPSDPDSRIAKMKDGRTHLAYKAEHAVDLDSEFVLAATVHAANQADSATLVDSVLEAQINLVRAGSEQEIEEAVADKGYHKSQALAHCEQLGTRTYIPEPKGKKRNWRDKPAAWRRATEANRRRVRGARGKRLQRLRSEYVERSFAHVCETGGGRRTWLRGLEQVTKRYLTLVAAHNLGLLMRKLFGKGKPRTLRSATGLERLLNWLSGWITNYFSHWGRHGFTTPRLVHNQRSAAQFSFPFQHQYFSTGC
jgi:transposase